VRKSLFPILGSFFLLFSNPWKTAEATPAVSVEQLNPATADWAFRNVPRPSKSDAAGGAKVSFVGNESEPAGMGPEVLTDGLLPSSGGKVQGFAFFSNANADPGSMLLDLGSVKPVTMVNTYSWHEFANDQGARGPQVFTLYGSAKGQPDPSDLSDWSEIAKVDTRPNATGENWGGQHGVSISDPAGPLGTFRWLLFACRPTLSPKAEPRWTHTFFCELDVHTADTQARAGDAEVATSGVKEIVVVFKTHFDIGYTDLISNVLARYRGEFMDKALSVIETNRQLPAEQRFAWSVPGWPLTHILGPLQTPEKRERISKAIREGALGVHAAPFTLHSESFDLEDLARGLHYSAQIARDHGLPLPRSAKMTDVPEHGWVLPTVLARGGIRFLQIGCNSACQYPRFPRLFWWEGPDGSRVLVNYTVDYGSGIVPPDDWPARTYLAMLMTGDNHGPPSAAEVEGLRARAARELPGVKVRMGTLDDFLAAIEAEKPALPVVRGDTPDTWIHGLLSMPEATKIARTIRPLEPALDSLDTHLRLAGLDTPPLAADLAAAYEGSLLYGEHTWGMNGHYGGRDIWGLEEWKQKLPADRQAKFLQSFDDHRAYIRRTQFIVTNGLQTRLDLLARSVDAQGPRMVVWNPLPWARSGLVDVPGKPGEVLWAENVPASGYRTYPTDPSDRSDPSPDPRPSTLETPFFKVAFDLQRGGIASLVEKKTGRELADASSPYALGQFLHEKFSKAEVDRFFKAYSRMPGGWALADLGKPGMPEAAAKTLENVNATAPGQPNPGAMAKPGIPLSVYKAVAPGDWKLSVRRGEFADVATLTAGDAKGLAKGYTIAFTFPRKAPYVEVEWAVADKTPDKMPEGGWLCFPFAIERPRFMVGRPGGPIDPAKDIVPGAGRHLMAVATGVTLAGEDGSAASLCPIDSPLVSLGIPGLWRFSLDYVPTNAAVWVNLYNNQWNTNFPLWQEGSWSVRVRFWPGADLVAPSWEARTPLLAAAADGPAGKLPTERPGLSVSRPGVLVTAFGANPDGRGTLLRVWEQSGVSGSMEVSLPGSFAKATPVNLRGEKVGEPVPVRGGKLTFALGAYAPASFVLGETP
jgi:alpha-mannosidase